MRDKCNLCGIENELEVHHLIPQNVSRNNKYPKSLKTDRTNFLMICKNCHEQLHALYSNQELRDLYYTKDLILEAPEFKKYVEWKKKHPDFKGHSKMSNDRKHR